VSLGLDSTLEKCREQLRTNAQAIRAAGRLDSALLQSLVASVLKLLSAGVLPLHDMSVD
jgi:hypothetical protein